MHYTTCTVIPLTPHYLLTDTTHLIVLFELLAERIDNFEKHKSLNDETKILKC